MVFPDSSYNAMLSQNVLKNTTSHINPQYRTDNRAQLWGKVTSYTTGDLAGKVGGWGGWGGEGTKIERFQSILNINCQRSFILKNDKRWFTNWYMHTCYEHLNNRKCI